MKLIFASPTYGPTEPEANKSQRVAIMHAANHGHQWVGDASPDKQTFVVGRGMIAKAGCDSEADYIFWCDSDIVLPPDAITRMVDHGLDFVTGIYFQKSGDHWPLIANFATDHYNWMVCWPENVIAPVDGCGFGCVLTSTKMLRAMRDAFRPEVLERKMICDLCESKSPHFDCVQRPMTDNEIREKANPWFEYAKFSEDFEFCQRAKKSGFQLYVDTAVLCGHLPAPPPTTIEDFKQKHPEFWGKEKTNGNRTSKAAQGEVGLHEGSGRVPSPAV